MKIYFLPKDQKIVSTPEEAVAVAKQSMIRYNEEALSQPVVYKHWCGDCIITMPVYSKNHGKLRVRYRTVQVVDIQPEQKTAKIEYIGSF